jgi:hypothetical protein
MSIAGASKAVVSGRKLMAWMLRDYRSSSVGFCGSIGRCMWLLGADYVISKSSQEKSL